MSKTIKCELLHDNFQNYKKYGIPKAQLVIADIPYNIGANAYGTIEATDEQLKEYMVAHGLDVRNE